LPPATFACNSAKNGGNLKIQKGVKKMLATKSVKTKKTAKPSVKKSVSKKDAKTTLPRKAKLTAKKAVYIDYPQANATVYCGHYCFRLGSVPAADWVKVSVNGGAWQDCRNANGYWWFDWWNFETGSFYAETLAMINGEEVKSSKRRFKVIL
jgi:hypothetical protein